MIFNPKDDYEKLAKLIYPSIEASGNVYYGQTRKLTLDALLKRNDIGFECHMENFYEYYDDTSTEKEYIPYFCWKLGSLKGSFRYITEDDHSEEDPFGFGSDYNKHICTIINPYEGEPDYILHKSQWETDPDITYRKDTDGRWDIYNRYDLWNRAFVYFVKYRLNIDNSKVENVINSGKFNTYESTISCEYIGICGTYGFDPTDKTNYDIGERHFFIGNENGVNYLYIKAPYIEKYTSLEALPLYKPLTFKAVDGDVDVVVKSINIGENDNSKKSVIYYRINRGEWQRLGYTDDIETIQEDNETRELFVSQPISLAKNDSVEITCFAGYYNRFSFSGEGFIEASGDATSMLYLKYNDEYISEDDPLERYREEYPQEKLDVMGVETIYDMVSLDIRHCADSSSANYRSAMLYMFKDCTKLIKAPYIGKCLSRLHSGFNNSDSYTGVFSGCTSLVNPPYMPIVIGYVKLNNMFAGCTSLIKSPEIHSAGLSPNSFSAEGDNMFAGCTSLKDIYLREVYSTGSGDTTKIEPFIEVNSEWLQNVPTDCRIHLNEKFDETNEEALAKLYITDRKQYIQKEEYHASYEYTNLFNYAESDLDIPYTTPYMVSSGGSGIYTYKTFDELDETLNTYNKDQGSYNQAVYGYKKFIDPVRFDTNIAANTINFTTADNSLQIKTDGAGSLEIQKLVEDGKTDILSCINLTSKDSNSGGFLLENIMSIYTNFNPSTETKGSISLTYDTGTGKSKVSIEADEIYINGTLFTHE